VNWPVAIRNLTWYKQGQLSKLSDKPIKCEASPLVSFSVAYLELISFVSEKANKAEKFTSNSNCTILIHKHTTVE